MQMVLNESTAQGHAARNPPPSPRPLNLLSKTQTISPKKTPVM
jgi:hypothetical protein